MIHHTSRSITVARLMTCHRLVVFALVVLLAVLAGCMATTPEPAPQASPRHTTAGRPLPPPPTSSAAGIPPPAQPNLRTLLLVTASSGTEDAGAFSADAGVLWIRGRCSGGDLTLHLMSIADLPIHCDELGGLPFQNQITLPQTRQVVLSVSAAPAVIWGLRAEQSTPAVSHSPGVGQASLTLIK